MYNTVWWLELLALFGELSSLFGSFFSCTASSTKSVRAKDDNVRSTMWQAPR